MAKKSFTRGLNSLLGEQPEQVDEVKKEQPAEKKEELKPTFMSKKETEKEELKPTFMSKKSNKKEVEKAPKKEIKNSSKAGTKENETRATFIVNDELLEKLKGISYWDRVPIKDLVNAALLDAVTKYERKNGEIKVITKN